MRSDKLIVVILLFYAMNLHSGEPVFRVNIFEADLAYGTGYYKPWKRYLLSIRASQWRVGGFDVIFKYIGIGIFVCEGDFAGELSNKQGGFYLDALNYYEWWIYNKQLGSLLPLKISIIPSIKKFVQGDTFFEIYFKGSMWAHIFPEYKGLEREGEWSGTSEGIIKHYKWWERFPRQYFDIGIVFVVNPLRVLPVKLKAGLRRYWYRKIDPPEPWKSNIPKDVLDNTLTSFYVGASASLEFSVKP